MTDWKYEYRAFLKADPTDIRAAIENDLGSSGLVKKVQNETDMYCVGGATDIAVQIRGSKVKMKGPIKAVDDLVDEMIDNRAYIPVQSSVIGDALGLDKDKKSKTLGTLDEVKAYMTKKGSKTSEVQKEMTKYEGRNLEIEVSKVVIDGTDAWTVCVAGYDATKVRETVLKYVPDAAANKMHYAEAVKQMGK